MQRSTFTSECKVKRYTFVIMEDEKARGKEVEVREWKLWLIFELVALGQISAAL